MVTLGVAVLAGCATVSDDPREGGLLGGLSGINSGAYDARVAEREERLQRLRETQADLDAETGQLEAQRSAMRRQLQADQARLQKLDADVTALQKKVDELTVDQGQDQQRVNELQSRLDGLKNGMRQQQAGLDALEGDASGDSQADLRRKQLEAQRKALQREYELLMQMQLELAR
jgi:chromosome segregation ATPase